MLPLPELLLRLSPPTLRAVLSAFGPVPDLPASASRFAIAEALFAYPAAYPASAPAAGTPKLPAKLVSFLFSQLPRFGTTGGRRAIVEAARALGDPRADSWLTIPAGDVTAHLAIELAAAKGLARRRVKILFALASLRTDRDLPERPTYELLARRAQVRAPKQCVTLLRRTFGDRLLRTFYAEDADGTLRLALFFRGATEGTLDLDDTASEKVVWRQATSAVVDEVRISPDGSRFAFTMAIPELLPEYAAAFELSLDPSVTLRPFQLLTTARLDDLRVPPVTHMEVVGARQRRPGGFRAEFRGANVLDAANQAGGNLDRGTIRMTLDDARKVDAFLQTPHRFDISDRSVAGPVCAALKAVGTFAPGALPDDARSLVHYEHGDWRWGAILGEDFERMKREKRFVRVASKHVVTKEHRMHGVAYVVRDVPGEPGMEYALAEDRSLGARLVSADDRIAWRLDLEVLTASMMREIGAVPAQAPLKIPGVLDLGVVNLTRARLRIVYVMGEPPEGWINAVLLACGVLTPVIFVPAGHAGDVIGMRAIELDVAEQLGAKSVGRALGRAAEALGVAHEVEAWRTCVEDVVVESGAKVAWVFGVRVPLPDHPYRMLVRLVDKRGQVISTSELGLMLTAGGDPDVRARKAKGQLEKHIREALEGAGVDPARAKDLILADGKKGYRLGLAARVV